MIARDDYLPHSLTTRGRRLVFSQGIWGLAILAALLLILFGGVTDRLIPLFAVGAFMAFTLSQAGMVGHWRKTKGFCGAMVVNAFGALATGLTVMVIAGREIFGWGVGGGAAAAGAADFHGED